MDQMLVDSGLFGRGLVPVDTPKMVSMYNQALEDLGIEPTALQKFGVDGSGWSPEIAAEKSNVDYLGFGPANRLVLIISPEQEGKPIQVPEYTFIRRLLRSYSERFKREIADITTTRCLEIGLENRVSEFSSPKDLLYMDSITVTTSAGSFMEQANEQKRLAASFMAPGTAWFDDTTLMPKLIDSATAHGNLLRRRTEFPPFLFSLIGNFWSRAFGGVFVLRAGAESILVVEDKKWLSEIKPEAGERYKAFWIGDKALIEHLLDEELLILDIERYKDVETQRELELLEHFVAIDALCKLQPDCDLGVLGVNKRKGILHAHKDELPHVYADIQRFSRSVQGTSAGVKPPRINAELARLLLRPNERLVGQQHQNVLWMLLQRVQEDPPDVLRLYTYDKERFFSLFQTWSASKRKWAAQYVSANYVPEMNR